MSSFSASALKTEYFDWLSEQESFDDVGTKEHPAIQIATPFLDDSNDGIDLYLYPDGDSVRVTDNGWTIDNLMTQGIALDKRSKTRNRIVDDVLDSYGIEMAEGSRKLFITASRNNFPNAKQRLLQGILRIIDLSYTSTDNVQSLFMESVAEVLERNDILFNKSRAVVAPNGLSFIFDFMIPTRKNGDTLVRVFHSPQFLSNAKTFAWDANFINRFSTIRPGKFVAIVDDTKTKQPQLDSFKAVLSTDKSVGIESITYSTLQNNIAKISN